VACQMRASSAINDCLPNVAITRARTCCEFVTRAQR
jgi:hypothetical protein